MLARLALPLAAALVVASTSCATGSTGADTPGGDGSLDSTPSDGGDDGSTSDTSVGDGDTAPTDALVPCVLDADPPAEVCNDHKKLDFGTVGVGSKLTRIFRVENRGGDDLSVDKVEVGSPLFTVETARYEKDPGGGTALLRVAQVLPYTTLKPGKSLYVEVSYTGGAGSGPLPADKAILTWSGPGVMAKTIEVPILGQDSGCPNGKAACDADPANGCETDVNTSMENCGACGIKCDPSGAVGSCNGGVCDWTLCKTGFADCDGDKKNGCEVNLLNDTKNCGTCARPCDRVGTTPVCAGGNCGIVACINPFADCNLKPDDGCELDTSTSMDNCGGCNLKCAPAHASATCAASTCTMGACDAGWTDCDAKATNGCEIHTEVDVANCGTCGTVCNPKNAYGECVAGACGWTTCKDGFADCDGDKSNGCEVDTRADSKNCGTCAHDCALSGTATNCSGGTCTVLACNFGRADCNSNLADGCETATTNDVNNCGACNEKCSYANAGATCSLSACSFAGCNPGFANCDGSLVNGCETDTQTDEASCGGCGTACNPSGAIGVCTGGACGWTTCKVGFADCDGDKTNGCEVDTRADETNCGSCGHGCALSGTDTTCSGGTCQVVKCKPGYGDCNGNLTDGCETQTSTSLSHCGACGQSCSFANAGAICSLGTCSATGCNVGYASCDGTMANGCEVDTRTELTNCGGCGVLCDPAGAVGQCTAGTCNWTACKPGFADCDGNHANGCEVDLKTDPSNCGTCATSCALAGTNTTCSGGTCTVLSCQPNYGDCDSNLTNGCETNTATSMAHCGGCNKGCARANGGATCTLGTCSLTSCNAGYKDCDGVDSNGCEVHSSVDVNNCGSCNNKCTAPGAVPTCAAGSCGWNTCLTNRADCDLNAANGCEVNVANDNGNCGECGHDCSIGGTGTQCLGTVCTVTGCAAGFGDCDSNLANGCETNTSTSMANCGACGNACVLTNGSSVCALGTCNLTGCNAGFANCDSNPANGCETNLNTSAGDCGSCGHVCSPANGTGACAAGGCVVASCTSGFGNCDGDATNGCESQFANDPLHCGSCSTNCATLFPNSSVSCSIGACGFTGCLPDFYNIDGVASNGCEYACKLLSADDDPDDGFVDENCDGIDGNAALAIFVAADGNDANPGTKANPLKTIGAGLIKAQSVGKTQVYVSNGTYAERVTLKNGISIYGGYSRSTGWSRGTGNNTLVQDSAATGGYVAGIVGANISSDTKLDRVNITTGDAPNGSGTSNYGLYCDSCPNLKVYNALITAGAGGTGAAGVPGSNGSNGGNAGNGGTGDCDSSGAGGVGGTAGASSCGRTGGAGGKGGNPGVNSGDNGGTGQVGISGGPGGGGGSNGKGGDGTKGTDGSSGANGASGAGGSGGSASSGYWISTSGGNGGDGAHGNGGGGGGGGGGQGGLWVDDGPGNGGGGGGGAGCGGTKGTAGTGGGGSFGVFVLNTSGTGFAIVRCTVTSSAGGKGGDGKSGGTPGTGGTAGDGGAYCTSEVGRGGNGGKGGNGGAGGHGGGGAGGPSYAVYRYASPNITITAGTRTPGAAGTGGTSPGNAGSTGAAGAIY